MYLKFFFIYLIYHYFFGCTGFSNCREQGLLSSSYARASLCGAFSCCRAQALGMWASEVLAHRLSCPQAGGLFPDQGSNPCPLHWQVDS